MLAKGPLLWKLKSECYENLEKYMPSFYIDDDFISFFNIAHEYVDGKSYNTHDDAMEWKHYPRYWSFVRGRGIHWSPVNSPHKGQWRGALMFSLICAWINGWVNNREAGNLRRHRAHYDVTVMSTSLSDLVPTMMWIALWVQRRYNTAVCFPKYSK